MSKTNRYAIHTTIKSASLARLKELREDYVRIAADRANKKRILEEARARTGQIASAPGRPNVDKYFGSRLPPVCRQLGCYVTDDGKFFYCINPHCHKDKKRETKYNRRKKSVVYFFCPKCKSREIQLHLKMNNYECLDCAYVWRH